jgi:hypothetical protein
MDPVDSFNIFEAGLWTTFALLKAVFGGRVRGMTPSLRILLSVSFLGFGISDLIELSTGAWWRPPGLLVYKGVCLLGIVGSCLSLRRNQRPFPGSIAASTVGTDQSTAPVPHAVK